MYLKFSNLGEIDELVFKSFGVSVKENDSAIGYFGTGLKFAIAIILRNLDDVIITAGQKTYEFSTTNKTIRNKDFKYITCNDEILGYTTDLGKDWKMWQAYRELYSNTKDEDGFVSIDDKIENKSGITNIYIKSQEFLKLHKFDSEKVFLKSEPICKNDYIEIHQGKNYYLYYKGIRVYDLSKPTMFTYNILNKIDLTEDRTIKYLYLASDQLIRGIITIPDSDIINKIYSHSDSFESDISYAVSQQHFNEKFVETVIGIYKKNPDRIPNSLYNTIMTFNKNITNFVQVSLDSNEKKKLQKAIEFCKSIDFDPEVYKITIVESLGANVLALAIPETNQIILSKKLFDMGLKQLISTIIEEVVHIREGLYDLTRSMQTYLFDKIVTLGEKYTGDCL